MNKIDLHITADRLQKWRACAAQYCLFVDRFPNGVTLTRELLLKHASYFELGWLARKLLPDEKWAVYDKAIAPARATYEEAIDTAWAAYNEGLATTSAWAAYNETIAWVAYEEARARALADILSLT